MIKFEIEDYVEVLHKRKGFYVGLSSNSNYICVRMEDTGKIESWFPSDVRVADTPDYLGKKIFYHEERLRLLREEKLAHDNRNVVYQEENKRVIRTQKEAILQVKCTNGWITVDSTGDNRFLLAAITSQVEYKE